MNIHAWIRGALALSTLTIASWSIAADHTDAPAVTQDPASDITDLYSFMDNGRVVFALNVMPFATASSKFSDKVQYVIHTESAPVFGMVGQKADIVCTFAPDQTISCWVGTSDYVTGDASPEAGLVSASGAVKVFAGLRDDPFFFNLAGFQQTVATIVGALASLNVDPAGCPTLDAATSQALVTMLKTNAMGDVAEDFFAGANVLSIVLSIDVSLLNAGGPILSAWASTNKGM